MYLTESSQGWGEATLKPGPKSARGTMGAPFSDRPPVTDPRYVFSPAVTPKAHYDNKVRDLVLDRLLKDGMSIERALESIRREFLLELSSGFVYDVLRDQAAALD